MNETVCGHTNWDTFILALTVDNDEYLYNKRCKWFDRLHKYGHTKMMRYMAKVFAVNSGANSVARRDNPDFRISRVDWNDIAESWQTDYEEYVQYKYPEQSYTDADLMR